MRVANILRITDCLPENILCLTFTEAATENMRSRLQLLIGKSASKVGIYTFHGFGASIIKNYPDYFYEAPLVAQLNELGEYNLLEQLMNKLHHDNPLAKKISDSYLHLPSVIRSISYFKRAGLNPDQLRIEIVKNQSFYTNASKQIEDSFKDSPTPKNIAKYTNLLNSLRKVLEKHPSESGELAVANLLMLLA